MLQLVTIETFVPETHAEKVRLAMGKAGGGKLGNCSHCSFSVKGFGRYRPEKGAKPAIGTIGKLEKVREERITMVCEKLLLKRVVLAIKKAHPYEEVPVYVYAVESSE